VDESLSRKIISALHDERIFISHRSGRRDLVPGFRRQNDANHVDSFNAARRVTISLDRICTPAVKLI
jgi:hypothetical protein